MISAKLASIIATVAFAAGSLFAPPVQQAIAAVIATDVQCTGCVGTSDVAGNAITAAKIKDGEVKAAEIATDAVGAAELQGVSKLLFGKCKLSSTEETTSVIAGALLSVNCTINGADGSDSAVASLGVSNLCFDASQTSVSTNQVKVFLRNNCGGTQTVGPALIGIVVFDK